MTHLVFCETGHGTRYHAWTDTPESFNQDLVWNAGDFENPDGAVESGYVLPHLWDEAGDLEGAAGEVADRYVEHREQVESERRWLEEYYEHSDEWA